MTDFQKISDERISAIEADKKHWPNIVYGVPIAPEARRLINILKRQHHELLMALKAERAALAEANEKIMWLRKIPQITGRRMIQERQQQDDK